jgi:hypothetical protein
MQIMKIKAIVTGATGMVGEGVLLESLHDPDVEQVLVINRKPGEVSHPKLQEIVRTDFSTLGPVEWLVQQWEQRWRKLVEATPVCTMQLGKSATARLSNGVEIAEEYHKGSLMGSVAAVTRLIANLAAMRGNMVFRPVHLDKRCWRSSPPRTAYQIKSLRHRSSPAQRRNDVARNAGTYVKTHTPSNSAPGRLPLTSGFPAEHRELGFPLKRQTTR